MKRKELSDPQRHLLEKLEVTFGKRPSRIKKQGKNLWVSFSSESRMKEITGVRFIHLFLVSPDGKILERKTLCRKV